LRLTRRAFVAGLGAAVSVGAAGLAFAQRPAALAEPTPVDVRCLAIPSLSVTDPERRRFGALTFRSGLELRSSLPGFGGFSGLWRSPDGHDLVALTDNSQWLTARMQTGEGQLVGLSNPVMAPLLYGEGTLLRRTRYYDTEGLVIVGGAAYVAVERHHALLRFDWAREGVRARGRLVPLPKEARALPGNSGLEGLAVAPARSPLAGALIAVAERSGDGDAAPTSGFILTGPRRGMFEVARSDGYDVTDLAFLSSGEALILERRFSLLRGMSARLRRLAPDAIRPGATADGPVIFESEPSHQIDNMEGLAVHREGSEAIVTMISDDNFSSLQKTVLLEFALSI
jgi:hypothetical protein